jgi:hypothetical protein
VPLQVLWIPEFFKARGAHSASLYAETFAVAAANLPGETKRLCISTLCDICIKPVFIQTITIGFLAPNTAHVRSACTDFAQPAATKAAALLVISDESGSFHALLLHKFTHNDEGLGVQEPPAWTADTLPHELCCHQVCFA